MQCFHLPPDLAGWFAASSHFSEAIQEPVKGVAQRLSFVRQRAFSSMQCNAVNVAWGKCRMTDCLSAEKDNVSAVEVVQSEMQGRVRLLAMPSEPGESVKACVRRVARATGLSFGQIRRLWYREWRVVPAHIADHIRRAAEAHERRLDQQQEVLRARHAALYGLAHHSSDPEFYEGRIAGFDQLPDESR